VTPGNPGSPLFFPAKNVVAEFISAFLGGVMLQMNVVARFILVFSKIKG